MAISFDAATPDNAGAVTSITITHTVASGDDRLLHVSAIALDTVPDDFTTITWDGGSDFSANQIQETVIGVRRHAHWYLVAPSTGSNDMVLTIDGAGVWLRAITSSYQGVDQSSPIDVSGEQQTLSGSTCQLTLTTTVDNCWLIGAADAVSATVTAGTNTTERAACTNDEPVAIDTNAPMTPAGNHDLNITEGGSGNQKIIQASAFKPASTAVTPTPNLLTMGAG